VTLIAALKTGKRVDVMADRCSADDEGVTMLAHPKIWRCGNLIIGGAGRMATIQQIKTFLDKTPEPCEVLSVDWVLRNWIPQARDIVEQAGQLKEEDGLKGMECSFLLAAPGVVIGVDGDFSACEANEEFYCIGSGSAYANALLKRHVLFCDVRPAQNLLVEVLQIAAHFDAGVRAPFDHMSLEVE
jgi:ATP-dependent protease HslVU (ClpYQ) peptidase subunit